MRKGIKIAITMGVFTLVVLYFIQACGNTKPTATACETFNGVLLTKTQEYFNGNLPAEDGDLKQATINELIAAGKITLSDLEAVGTTCSGNVYVSKGPDGYYYSNDVTCGTCSTSSLYTAWSAWSENIPTLLSQNSQIQTGLFYNYGKGKVAYTDWSDWGLTLEELKEPELPEGVTVSNTEKEEKIQYSYRDGSFKWYKLTGGTEYYSNGAYSETTPGSSYSKDTSSKKVSRTTAIYTSQTALTSTLTGLDYDIETPTAYKTTGKKYIYSKSKETGCSVYKSLYKCYKVDGNLYTCALTTDSTSCSYTSESAAISACQTAGNSSCSAVGCAASSWTYHYEFEILNNLLTNERDWTCVVEARTTKNLSKSCTSSNIKELLIAGADGIQDIDEQYCVGQSNNTRKTLYWNSTSSTALNLAASTIYSSTCLDVWARAESGYTKWNYSGTNYTYNQTSCTGLYTVYATTPNKVYYNNGATYTTCSDKTGYTNSESTGLKSRTECQTPAYTTYYLKADGIETKNKSEASYLSDAEFAALGSLATGYTKTSSYITDTGIYVEGTCPGGVSSSTCTQTTVYKAKIYTYKWYKSTTSTKTWYNDGEYTSTQPKGYQADKSTAKWGEWSEFSDTKINSSTTRQVKTQVLKRIRKSYMTDGELNLDEFLPLNEFETKVGKTISELAKDTTLVIQKKLMYRFRTLN